jgi:hypothetical protein
MKTALLYVQAAHILFAILSEAKDLQDSSAQGASE